MLSSTFKRYLSETKKLLRFFGVFPRPLYTYSETLCPFTRNPCFKPKTAYCPLEWSQIQRIYRESRRSNHNSLDNILGRSILTFAFTTGARVGSLLPPEYGPRRDKHIPITRSHVRSVGGQYHVWQPINKTDPEGRGRLIIASPTGYTACPISALQRLLWLPTDEANRLFLTGLAWLPATSS